MNSQYDSIDEKMKKVLVTGASGFIGNNLVNVLQNKGYQVRILVIDPKEKNIPPGTELFIGDLTSPESLVNIENNISFVFHCAGILGKWGTDNSIITEVNIEGTVNLIKRFAGTSISKLIHLSAGGVTGPVNEVMVDESYKCHPATEYEKSKYLGEQQAISLSKELNIPVVVVRPTFTYGPGDPHKIGLFRAIKNGSFAFIGDGESVNHPVYIDDLISGILLAMEKGRTGEIYIIGGEKPVTKKELVYTIADILDVNRPKIKIPRWLAWFMASIFEFTGRRLHFEPILTRSRVMMMADNFGYSIQKAQKELGYQPLIGLQEGIIRTAAFYKEKGLL
ncbi:MAG: hypothetical protein A2161_00700 [Candidatus Schekmanbacteria bacterium RBG_13_48_7]|uniref:NAD-dependent epimerase/dehydratase domain-containing protein n=1 Tax=Candidatus Schekmanbacteria bacterium RBG_13_48_7 TaxID=1817878 RepID=A0A1F7RW96_9BACT|nr:MAG: hypothetical protein A2161_00700 [Candidatus Schekmanbacteria bacterium RBG_13_48_7]